MNRPLTYSCRQAREDVPYVCSVEEHFRCKFVWSFVGSWCRWVSAGCRQHCIPAKPCCQVCRRLATTRQNRVCNNSKE